MGCCSRLLCYKNHNSKETSDSSNTPISLQSIPQEDSVNLVNQPLSQQGDKYEVLLSYSRGEDTQESSFASLLYSSLRKARISVFGNEISIESMRSIIEDCEISVIIISEKYASSRRCLEELTKIMEFRRSYDQVMIPIFYGVDPSEVQSQKSSFGEAFRDLIQRISPTKDQVSRWRTTLSEAGGIHGFVVPDFESEYESNNYIQNIAMSVRRILDRKVPFARGGRLVGMASQVKEVIAMLQKRKSKDVVCIGIWGMAGIGKSTLARLISDLIQYEFERTCFLAPVLKETWETEGSVFVQNELVSLTCEAPDVNVDSFESGSVILKESLRHNKVLVVIDDMNDIQKLHALYGSRKRFGKGNRIIIATRNLDLLKAFKVDDVYRMKPLNDDESLQLFSRTTFQQATPEVGFIKLCRRVVAYTEGLPLALEVFGSFLKGQSPREMESALMKLSTDLPYGIYNKLKVSFDSLDDNGKEIFLNIAVFYNGEDMDDLMQKLNGGGLNADIGIRVLVDRSLLTIDDNKKLRMHNLLQLMGRQIIRQMSQNELQNRGHKYGVFLSFRGEDTRATFSSHLYTALCNAGINVFKDDVELARGNHIKAELLQAIGSSKIAIIIFSKDYAGSKWCLEEMSVIMEVHKSNDQVVLPVFYNVDPSEIRHQTSSFGEAFNNLIQKVSPPEVQVFTWRRALAEVGGIAGFVVLGSKNESEEVKTIVQNVCDILDKKDLFVAEHPVGVDNRVQEVITMIQDNQSEDVVMVGLWGMGGLGKTTIAKAIYNEIGQTFESRCYLSNIREVWGQEKDQVSLQNKLLSKICKPTKLEIDCIDSGKNILRDRLRHKKALVVLDDVDELAQLKALVGSRDWFKPGSAIIITTRNKRLLHEMDCAVYLMKNLDTGESFKLFSWHAFKQESPEEDFIELSRDIVAYSGGLPLALEIFGSYLFERELDEWKSVLERLKKIPFDKIHEKLKISFDGLSDQFDEKDIFLDIACFFVGMDKNDVTLILNGCGFVADIGIKTLLERSLITIDEKNTIGMHDLLRDMGREIIREQYKKEIGKRSRLWFHEDVQAVLLKHMGTEAIEGLSLKLADNEEMHFETEAFKMMVRLRLLRLDNVRLKGDYKYISRDLKWLCWYGFPVKYIPTNFYQQELVAIDLEYSSLTQVWKKPLLLKRLKILNLSHSPHLVQTPDFSKLPNLEKLILQDCPSLSTIHHSIGLLHKLLVLDLEDCIGLLSLPRSVYRLKCLKTLILSGCVMIEKLEEDIEQMESLTTLIAPTIKQAPFSIVRLKSILYLSVCGHEGLSNNVIPSLFRSWISPTNNPLPRIPSLAGMTSSCLWKMLNRIHGRRLPAILSSDKPKQQSVLLEDRLELPDSNSLGHYLIQIGQNTQVFHKLTKRVSEGLYLTNYEDDCILPDDNYPYWLTFKGEGAFVKFEVPPSNGHGDLKGITICCVYYFPSGDLDVKACESCINCLMIINYTKKTTLVYMKDKLNSLEEAERKEIMSNLDSDDQVEVKAIFENGFAVKKTSIYFIYKESFDEHMEGSSTCSTKHKCEEE